MSEIEDQELFEFGEFRLNVAEHLLVRVNSGDRIRLSEKAFETLCVLVRNSGHLVSKNELLSQVWADSFVEENNLSKSIHAIRRALGEKPGKQQFIETVKKHGFRFVTEVRRVEPTAANDAVYKKNGFQLQTKSISPPTSPRLLKKGETNGLNAVVALADWRREADEKESVEQASTFAPKELREKTVEFKAVPTTPVGEGKPQLRSPHVIFALAVFLITTVFALGYYFYDGKSVSNNAGSKKSIAVLPVKPINASNRDDLYEVGIADSIIHRLSAAKGFYVRPLSATRQYADLAQDPVAAGREQKSDYVLVSNYQLAEGKIRITAQLYNVASGQIEETYKSEKDAGNVFAAQDAIANEVGNLLFARFAAVPNKTTAKRGTTNEEAYRLYLQGRNLTVKRKNESHQKAIEYFEQAIRLDPNFALAYARMAHAYYSSGLPENNFANAEKAKEIVNKALELDPNVAEAYVSRGYITMLYDWDLSAAERDFLRAIELEPNNDTAHWLYGLILTYRQRFDEGLGEMETALNIDSGATVYMIHRGRILYYARRYDEAITQFKQAADLDDRAAMPYAWLIHLYERKGDYASAYQSFLKREERSPRKDQVEIFQKAYEASGWRGIREKEVELATNRFFDRASLHALQGEKDAAFDNLNRAVERRDWRIITLTVEPAFDNLRDDPRFDELVRRVGLK
jgi:DNA-binding winged helix-turn-helix (wHTH) protein/tetratricopeptide (TPR) repeat protein